MEFYVINKINGIAHRYYSKDTNDFQKGLQIVNRHTQREDSHVKMEAEIRGLKFLPQDKEHQNLPIITGSE